MSLERAIAIAASGLTAQRTRMEVVSSNLANARTTRTPEGGPYQRRQVLFAAEAQGDPFSNTIAGALRRVRVVSVGIDPSASVLRHEPGHPDADARGFVAYPNVEPIREMIDMLSATRSYEANVTLVRSLREMMQSALQIVA